MLPKNHLAWFGIVFFLSTITHAQVIHGSCQMKNTSVNELVCFGPTQLTNVTVKGPLSVFGPLELIKTTVNGSVDVKGLLSCKQSVVKGPIIVEGPITAVTTVFHSNVTSYANEIILNQTEVKGSLSIESKEKKPILQLINHTIIRGNITFSKQAGVVNLTEESQVLGTLVNGTQESK